MIDLDGMEGVRPEEDKTGIRITNQLQQNTHVNNLVALAKENSVFQKVMRPFMTKQSNIWIHLGQLKDNAGNPTGPFNMARTESPGASNNPVGQYGQNRIVINSDILNSSGDIAIDKTLAFMALLHEGIHAKMYDTFKKDPTFSNYPGYKDFLFRPEDGSHHNQMEAFNRDVLIEGMKEFDEQIGATHTEDWYEAMSWYGLQETKAWSDFVSNNPERAQQINDLLRNEAKNIRNNTNNENN